MHTPEGTHVNLKTCTVHGPDELCCLFQSCAYIVSTLLQHSLGVILLDIHFCDVFHCSNYMYVQMACLRSRSSSKEQISSDLGPELYTEVCKRNMSLAHWDKFQVHEEQDELKIALTRSGEEAVTNFQSVSLLLAILSLNI